MSYSSEVLADSPLVYWRLGESSGTTATDSSGNSNPGAHAGSVTLGATGLLVGDADTAATFSGGVVFRSASSASIFTAEAIIKPTAASGTQVIMSMQDTGAAAWTFRLDGSDLRFYYWNASNVLQTPIVASTTIVGGTTYRVAVTFTASGSAFLYVNGSQVGTASVTTMNSVSSSTLLRVGGSGGGENFFGVIDEPAYYTTALSSSRISAHNAAATGGGSANATVTPPAATATALAPAPAIGSVVSVTPPAATATATAPAPSISNGTGGNTVAPPAATATAMAPAPTLRVLVVADTSNALDGLDITFTGTATIERPAAVAPSGLVLAEKYDKAIAYPQPVMDNGRPT